VPGLIRGGEAVYRFFHSNCVDLLRHLSSASVQTIVTSPPYNLGVAYRTYDDGLPRSEYPEWTAQWIQAARDVLDPAGSLFLNVGSKPSITGRRSWRRPRCRTSISRTHFTG
jgi:DNA modification methylase